MGLTRKLDSEDAKFSLYFLALDGRGAESAGGQWADQEGIFVCFGLCLCLVTQRPRLAAKL